MVLSFHSFRNQAYMVKHGLTRTKTIQLVHRWVQLFYLITNMDWAYADCFNASQPPYHWLCAWTHWQCSWFQVIPHNPHLQRTQPNLWFRWIPLCWFSIPSQGMVCSPIQEAKRWRAYCKWMNLQLLCVQGMSVFASFPIPHYPKKVRIQVEHMMGVLKGQFSHFMSFTSMSQTTPDISIQSCGTAHALSSTI